MRIGRLEIVFRRREASVDDNVKEKSAVVMAIYWALRDGRLDVKVDFEAQKQMVVAVLQSDDAVMRTGLNPLDDRDQRREILEAWAKIAFDKAVEAI